MIIEETTFGSLLAICASPAPTIIHRYKDIYFGLAHIGDSLYIAVARDAPKEQAPFIEYNTSTRRWRLIDPSEEAFSRDPSVVKLPVVEVKKLGGDVGEKIKSVLDG